MSTPSGDTKGVESVHPYHRPHTSGTVRLQSRDGTIFTVDAWRLALASVVFRDMLETSEADSEPGLPAIDCSTPVLKEASTPIETEISSRLLDAFINMVNVSAPCVHLTSFDDLKTLLIFCEKFDCQKTFTDKIRQRLIDTAKGEEWDVPLQEMIVKWHLRYLVRYPAMTS
ncbi:hypothetical protein IAR55_006202 [Kwoniella newhampshirensis]|uniref:BTB domain-containing protein n=1 Tax=Kwoniella newhampshirensis TaxID=1651941 RepID=A0AAW0YUY5_9TREE